MIDIGKIFLIFFQSFNLFQSSSSSSSSPFTYFVVFFPSSLSPRHSGFPHSHFTCKTARAIFLLFFLNYYYAMASMEMKEEEREREKKLKKFLIRSIIAQLIHPFIKWPDTGTRIQAPAPAPSTHQRNILWIQEKIQLVPYIWRMYHNDIINFPCFSFCLMWMQ